jgi:hypothetical protein
MDFVQQPAVIIGINLILMGICGFLAYCGSPKAQFGWSFAVVLICWVGLTFLPGTIGRNLIGFLAAYIIGIYSGICALIVRHRLKQGLWKSRGL